ncbi:serine/arginine repetitive matrix protein 1 [Alosa sapidissima]|uniref:serine/arginine repetitive matrix protein 1 n=1 Tax=Alosa sapidissima TaxID=34773 RepID=UPI001C081792|nr:serine/arginine repetitive matrix protein 1 [Alosa sapidissima]
MIRQRQQKPEMLATVMPTRPEEPLTLAGRNAMTQRNGPNLQPLAKSGRHRKTPALHLSSAPCQDEAAQKSQRPDPQAQPQTAEVDRELENLPPPTRRPLKLAPLPPAPASELKDTQQPAKARGGGRTTAAAVPPPPEPKVGVRKLEGLGGTEACPRKVKACPAREASPARSPERPPLCRMRPVVEFPKAAAPNPHQQQQQQSGVGAKTLLLPVPQAERPRQKSPGREQENFISSTPPPTPSTKKCGPLSLAVSPSRLAQDAQVGKGCAPTSSECSSLVEGSPGRARPRLRRIPRLEEDQGRSAPSQAPAPAVSVAGLPPQEKEEEAKPPGHLAQAGGQRAERTERALREATRVLEKASRRTPAPGKASRKMVVNVIPAAVH